MTAFERLYTFLRAFDHPLYQHVHRRLANVAAHSVGHLRVLDVGGRRSNYTIGLHGEVTITDVERTDALQHALDLGATGALRAAVLERRSNVNAYLIDDMTQTSLRGEFDVVVAVEVLEHVKDDTSFVRNVSRVLKPGGLFLMTTPNGDFLPTPYPGHIRHYSRAQLVAVLKRFFSSVEVGYAVNADVFIKWGVHRPSLRTPVRSLISPIALCLSYHLETLGFGGSGPVRKRHLLAIATK